jgi:proteasome lid subunit RPN8/RPN11
MATLPRLELHPDHEREIREHGQRAFPDECCGFLIGRDRDDVRRIDVILAATNDRNSGERHHRFTIPPEAFVSATREARRLDLDVLGFYHSHPNAPARPSQYDLEHAWPVYSYLIVSVRDRRADDMTCWVMRNDRTRFDEQTVTAMQASENGR